ncbi:hypothetical protein KI688_001557 [Linnemannia hyalina]|uniref:Tyrosine specific protein phosphatases domain-containing protein n=1 Tax=Linnemannia hyalina TaxID=64524 RepID=A0A9P7XS96_9FUNG|nr:hypothetical protein KI688_001557 [Linnemannia hyalina]
MPLVQKYLYCAYVEDVVTLLQRYKSEDTVVICHSYGCTIGTHLYSRLATSETLNNSIKAMVMIGPKAVITEHEIKGRAQLAKTPDWVVDFARKLDRMGGIHSKSVNRLLHASAGDDLRRRQLRWNKASRTATNDRIQSPLIIPKAGHQTMLEKWEHVTPIISSFLIKDCGMTTMDPAWQITKKCQQENKWSLKNTEKWMNTPIMSSPLGRGPGKFRAMKVLRQTDPDHSPSAFLAKHPEVGFIIDMSKDEPPYRTTDFEATSITYTKLATVSKIPPPKEDVERFIAHCNACWKEKPGVDIAVHCHYGFNRTGFMLCSYLIQEQGYSVAEALHHFELARPPRGIRHDHFKGELYLRYEPPKQLKA